MMSAWHKKIPLKRLKISENIKIWFSLLYRLWGTFKVNCYDFDEFRRKIMTISDDGLMTLLECLTSNKDLKDREDKILLLKLEIKRRFKLKNYLDK